MARICLITANAVVQRWMVMGMREKLIALIEQAKFCSVEELADYLIAAGLKLPTECKNCKCYDPGLVRPYLGWCSNWDTAVRETGYCYQGDPKEGGCK